jgi:hypothetical protein
VDLEDAALQRRGHDLVDVEDLGEDGERLLGDALAVQRLAAPVRLPVGSSRHDPRVRSREDAVPARPEDLPGFEVDPPRLPFGQADRDVHADPNGVR